MSLVSKIISDARFALSDPEAHAWKDDRLVRLVNNGIRDIALNTKVNKTHGYLELIDSQEVYYLADVLKITRVEYEREPLTFYTYEEMDAKFGPDWQNETSTSGPTAVVYDQASKGKLRLYPVQGSSVFTFVDDSSYGIITNITEIDEVELTPTAEMSGLGPDVTVNEVIKIYYIKSPDPVTLADDTGLDDEWDDALVFYVTGRALRDNTDAQNREVGNEELGFYQAAINKISKENSKAFIGNNKRSTGYTGAFE